MAQNNPNPNPLPNFNNISAANNAISAASNTVSAANLSPQTSPVQDLSTRVDDGFTAIDDRLTVIEDRLTIAEARAKNDRIKARNAHGYAHNRGTDLQPLLDIQTGVVIPNCPQKSRDINFLTAAEANRILQALQVAPPALLSDKRRSSAGIPLLAAISLSQR